MKRTISHSEIVPAFVLNHKDLKHLVSMMYGAVGEHKVSVKFELDNSERFEFMDLKDLMDYSDFPQKITTFEIRAFGENNQVVSAGNTIGAWAGFRVDAHSGQNSWNVGIVHEVVRYLKGKKVWYFWFYSKWLDFPLFLFGQFLLFGILFSIFAWSISDVMPTALLLFLATICAMIGWPILWFKCLSRPAKAVFPRYAILQKKARNNRDILTILFLALGAFGTLIIAIVTVINLLQSTP